MPCALRAVTTGSTKRIAQLGRKTKPLVAARQKVQVARALATLPFIDAAFARGELSYSKVRAITRIATTDNEELLLAYARTSTGAGLERICSKYKTSATSDAAGDDERRFRWHGTARAAARSR